MYPSIRACLTISLIAKPNDESFGLSLHSCSNSASPRD
ncbi:uncharacterized protein METZ01_LOCUS253517 [marine metagenome]|uniref:Uncharacterized protein n=1 Tax=marine metagenome TaxID=408172 RepID=A0A382IP62_9ZZZZ